MCNLRERFVNLREGFVNLREGFVEAPWRLREAFSKTRSAKASRRRHGRLHLETICQIMPDCKENKQADAGSGLFPKAFSVRRVVV